MIRRIGVDMLDFGAQVLRKPLVVSYRSIKTFENTATLPTPFPSKFLTHVAQILQPNLVQDLTKSFHWIFISRTQATLLMGPEDFVEIPSTQSWHRGPCMEVAKESPCVTLFGRVSEAINTSRLPFTFQGLANHNIDLIW